MWDAQVSPTFYCYLHLVQPQKQNHQWQQSGPNDRQSPVRFAVAFTCSSFIYANYFVFLFCWLFAFAVDFGLQVGPAQAIIIIIIITSTAKRPMYNVQRGTTSNFNCIIMCSLQFIIFSFPCCWLFSSSSTSAFCFSRRCSPVIYVFTSQLFPLPLPLLLAPFFVGLHVWFSFCSFCAGKTAT